MLWLIGVYPRSLNVTIIVKTSVISYLSCCHSLLGLLPSIGILWPKDIPEWSVMKGGHWRASHFSYCATEVHVVSSTCCLLLPSTKIKWLDLGRGLHQIDQHKISRSHVKLESYLISISRHELLQHSFFFFNPCCLHLVAQLLDTVQDVSACRRQMDVYLAYIIWITLLSFTIAIVCHRAVREI